MQKHASTTCTAPASPRAARAPAVGGVAEGGAVRDHALPEWRVAGRVHQRLHRARRVMVPQLLRRGARAPLAPARPRPDVFSRPLRSMPEHVTPHGTYVEGPRVAAMPNEPATKMQCHVCSVMQCQQCASKISHRGSIQQPAYHRRQQAGAGRATRQGSAPSSRRPWARRSRRAPSPAGSRARSGCCAAARRPPSPSGAPPSGTSCGRGGGARCMRSHVPTGLLSLVTRWTLDRQERREHPQVEVESPACH